MTYKVNSWDEFSPLKTLILGSVFDTTFFDAIKNQKIQYALKKGHDLTISMPTSSLRRINVEVTLGLTDRARKVVSSPSPPAGPAVAGSASVN